MDVKSFYGSRPRTFLALVPENPEDSDADLSDDDPVDDPDYLPTPAEENGDTSFDSMDEEEVASTSSSSKPPSKKKRRMGKNSLKTVSLAKIKDTPEPSPPDGKEGRRRLWRHEDIETFQVPVSSFNLPDAVKTPFQYFKMLFTDEMITHISEQTNLYTAQELGDPISTTPEEIEKFLAMLLFMGVFSFPAIDDYWWN